MNHKKQEDDDDSEGTRTELLPGGQVNATSGNSGTTRTPEQQAKRKKIIKWGIIGAIITIIIILAIVLPLTLIKKDDNSNPPFPPGFNPYNGDPKKVVSSQSSVSGVIETGSTIDNAQALFANDILKAGSSLGVNTKQIPSGVNNPFVKNIKFNFDMFDYRTARLVFSDNDNPKTRWDIPANAVPKKDPDTNMRLESLGFKYELSPFHFSFSDVVDGSTFITTKDMALVMMDKFIQVDFLLPSQRVFGFGERVHQLQLEEGTWTMWATGQDQMIDDGQGRKGTYGVHPFILIQGAKKDDFIGMYFKNSNAQTPVIKYTSDGKTVLSYITMGGNLEAYFFIHGSAKSIIQSYQNLIGGNINLPPFWALGWQQASQKYKTQADVVNMIQQYNKAGIPLDTVYLDFPYLKAGSNFIVDEAAFTDLQGLAKQIHDAKMKLVVVVDSSIVADVNDAFYKQGDTDKTFIKSKQYQNTDLNGNLVNYRLGTKDQKVVFVDWFNDKCVDMWSQGLSLISTKVPFDGLWLNLNEPITAQPGEIDIAPPKPPTPPTESEKKKLEASLDYSWYTSFDQKTPSTFFLPFVPQYFGKPNQYGNFDQMTLSLNGSHSDSGASEYDVHNLYGHMQAQRTHQIMVDAKSAISDQRPFILSRSTFSSSGRFASHYLGETPRDWTFMKHTVAGIQSMNMFGIPHVGADVCGYKGSKRDDEMCARWIQLSTFYPLARSNQNDKNGDATDEPQEPYAIKDPKFAGWATAAIQDRYQYLRHMYTCLYEVSQWSGSCIDPAFYYYPTDENLYLDTSASFMVGGALLVTPVLEGGDPKTIKAYLPKGQWVNLASAALDVNGNNDAGSTVDINAQIGKVNVHLRPGSLIPWQDNRDKKVMTTNDLQAKPISIVANRDTNGVSQGTILLDGGSSRAEISTGQYEYYSVNLQAKSIQMNIAGGNRGTQDQSLDQVLIVNAKDLSTTKYACYYDLNLGINQLKVDFLPELNALRIYPDAGKTLKFSDFQAIHFAADGELNLCDASTYAYTIVGGVIPPLTATKVSFELQHSAKTLPNIQVDLRIIQQNIVNIYWTWKKDAKGNLPAGKRMPVEVPMEFINTNIKDQGIALSQFISITDKPFQLNVKYRTQNEPSNVFQIKALIYDQYLNWVAARINTAAGAEFQGIFGLGERANKDFFYKDGVYSMMSRDQPTPEETGKAPGNNMYGVHPFFAFRHKKQAWVGILYKLGQTQDWYIKNDATAGTVDLNTIAPGGVADIYVMQGTTPDAVISAYHTLVGKPVLIPQWALGWNQCKWGYKTIEDVEEVVKQYAANDLPLDVQWTDIDYLRDYRDFSYDWENYWRLPQFVQELHAKNMKYVPIIDAGIAYRPKGNNYTTFEDGQSQGLFIQAPNKETFIGQVWPNDAAYPDYYNHKTATWWGKNLDAFWKVVNFDGVWEDMNEASNFCYGACYDRQRATSEVKYQLKYTPTSRNLEFKGIAMDATHSNGYMQLDTHNFFGTQMVKATHEWFEGRKQRTFIIERSSFAGMGKYGSRWLGDNFSQDKFMAYSVTGTMLMNMFGIPFTGADICGFIGDTTPELCARWHIVGAFYPFSRNHNNINQLAQEPYTFTGVYEGTTTYLDIMRYAIKTKYEMIRYYYSSLLLLSLRGSGTFYKPLFFEFPEDMMAYQGLTTNIMLGDALKLSVNSEKLGQDVTTFYFPKGTWCNLYKPAQYPCFVSTGQTMDLPTKAYDFHLHIRQGAIVPHQALQDAAVTKFSTTKDLQSMPIDLHILGEQTGATSATFRAQTTYLNDDGLTTVQDGEVNGYSINAQNAPSGLSMQFFQIMTATNHVDKTTGCSAVNQNDFVNTIYFYNAENSGINTSYDVMATMTDGKPATKVGSAKYVDADDRLVVTLTAPLCMSLIQRLDFTKTQ